MLIKLIFLSYLLGSIPFGFILVKVLGKGNIRNFGSGNIGTTNVSRVLGSAGGFTVFILDALKGFTASYLAYNLIPEANILFLLIPLASVLGHVFSLFLKFKGGKGVATSFGTLFYISVPSTLILLGIWVISVFLSRISSVGSLLAAIFIAPLLYLFGCNLQEVLFGLMLTIIIFFTHIDNIKRLCQSKELKI